MNNTYPEKRFALKMRELQLYKNKYDEAIIAVSALKKKINYLEYQFNYLKEHSDITKIKKATGELRDEQLAMCSFAEQLFNAIKEIKIKPFLIGGSLIGYVRHNGFIPWDDDLDFGLTRSDYTKLIKYAKDKFIVATLKDDDKFSTWTLEKGYRRVASYLKNYPNDYILDVWINQIQIYSGTSIMDRKLVDFFSFDFYNDNYSFKELSQWIDYICKKKEEIDNIIKIRDFLNNEILKNCNIVKKSSKLYFGIDSVESYTRKWNTDFIPADIIFPLKEVDFENAKFFVPNKPEKYLEYEFRNYMSYPDDLGISTHYNIKKAMSKICLT